MALFFLPPAVCPPAEPSVHRAVWVAPASDWPRRRELPEHDHPVDGEGSAPMFVGLGAYSNTANVTVQSTSSGSYDMEVAWLPNNLPLVVSTRDFPVEPFRAPTSPAGFVRVRLDSKGHPQILPVRRTTGSRSGR
jgi:hypothetical protein